MSEGKGESGAADGRWDVIVIGAGPAGYAAAIRAAQLGMRVACIDKSVNGAGQPSLGGTCLNWGCIPSKALLDASHKFVEATTGFATLGIEAEGVSMNVAKMMAQKDAVVAKLTQGVAGLFDGNGVTWLPGHGRLHGHCAVEYTPAKGDAAMLAAEHVVLAPGSVPIEIDQAPLDGKAIVDSQGALEFAETPRRLGVIGAGVIGLELGSVWARLGAETIMLEALDEFLSMADQRIARDALRAFRGQGLDIRLGTRDGRQGGEGRGGCHLPRPRRRP